MCSSSDPSNKHALPTVIQLPSDAVLIEDYLQEKSLQLVDVESLAGPEAYMFATSSCEGHAHGNYKLCLSYETPKEIYEHDGMKALDLILKVSQWDPNGSGHGHVYIRVAQQKPDGHLIISPTSKGMYVIMMQHEDFTRYNY